MVLFDTHTHLLDEAFDADRDVIAASLRQNDVHYALEACTSVKQARDILAFVSRYANYYCALGTHPHDAAGMEEADMPLLEELLADARAVAVGEIGLDYHYDFSPRNVQREWFSLQLALAQSLHLPVVLHVREATEDALDILRAHKSGLTGVMHCFSGSYETACACLDMGLYIAFGGALTFKNAKKSVDVAERLPLDRLLIETDCPYMTPVPFRSQRNDPTRVRLVCECLADIKGLPVEHIARVTTENALRLFRIPPECSSD